MNQRTNKGAGDAEPVIEVVDESTLPAESISTLDCLALDAFACEIIATMHGLDVPSILLKGPTIARWLYPEGGRSYGDVDLLVPVYALARAQEALGRYGLREARSLEAPEERSHHAAPWTDDDGWTVDLHWNLTGIGLDDESTWRSLSEHTTTMSIAATDVNCLDEPARAMHIALHAAQHGRSEPRPIRDLCRALAVLNDNDWAAVIAVAQKVDAIAAFSAGLRLVPEGASVADRLGLPTDMPRSVALRLEGGGGSSAMSVARIAEADGLRARLSAARHWVLPTPAKVRRLAGEDLAPHRLTLHYLRHFSRAPLAVRALFDWHRADRSR